MIEYLLKDKAVSIHSEQSLTDFKEEQYNKLADHVRQHMDIDQIYKILTNG